MDPVVATLCGAVAALAGANVIQWRVQLATLERLRKEHNDVVDRRDLAAKVDLAKYVADCADKREKATEAHDARFERCIVQMRGHEQLVHTVERIGSEVVAAKAEVVAMGERVDQALRIVGEKLGGVDSGEVASDES